MRVCVPGRRGSANARGWGAARGGPSGPAGAPPCLRGAPSSAGLGARGPWRCALGWVEKVLGWGWGGRPGLVKPGGEIRDPGRDHAVWGKFSRLRIRFEKTIFLGLNM